MISLATLALKSGVTKPILMVEEFMDVILEDLSRVLIRWEIEFAIKLIPNTKLISIAPYRMAPMELKQSVN